MSVSERKQLSRLQAEMQRGGYGAGSLRVALLNECQPGGTFYNEEDGYINPVLAHTFIELLAQCPGHVKAAMEHFSRMEQS